MTRQQRSDAFMIVCVLLSGLALIYSMRLAERHLIPQGRPNAHITKDVQAEGQQGPDQTGDASNRPPRGRGKPRL